MTRPRLIVALLVGDRGLVKTAGFADPLYVGDPVNAVRVFSRFGADEIMLLDINAGLAGRPIDFRLVEEVASEATVPLSIGGGIRQLGDIARIVAAGAEKVVIGRRAAEAPSFVAEAAREYGSSTISVCMDVGHAGQGDYAVRGLSGSTAARPAEFARRMEGLGAGELVVQSIERDGTMAGYDLALIREVGAAVSVPVVALGGAGCASDCAAAVEQGAASAAAAGSLFVFHRRRGAVLLSYPSRAERGL
ncbi:MAG: imidazole glycerol phosphate synthase subunit HisF [Alphaproteobacteria bacterium]|nr:imidazole glycerol phosphate synthase subunit HisF [Alphaproteobacteria bacterium]MBV9373206.1 imidazole glycerol phosphate synthase subunit HisF [Alphaproteobacteria bacterium]MBV9900295.1 imidazole glycerol phosphate synthase subunit HisF [Alphaproteobacteria bacterium]